MPGDYEQCPQIQVSIGKELATLKIQKFYVLNQSLALLTFQLILEDISIILSDPRTKETDIKNKRVGCADMNYQMPLSSVS